MNLDLSFPNTASFSPTISHSRFLGPDATLVCSQVSSSEHGVLFRQLHGSRRQLRTHHLAPNSPNLAPFLAVELLCHSRKVHSHTAPADHYPFRPRPNVEACPFQQALPSARLLRIQPQLALLSCALDGLRTTSIALLSSTRTEEEFASIGLEHTPSAGDASPSRRIADYPNFPTRGPFLHLHNLLRDCSVILHRGQTLLSLARDWTGWRGDDPLRKVVKIPLRRRQAALARVARLVQV